MDDLQLLREYIGQGSQEAFAELVNRYVGVVYSAAMRQMGESHAAEDVAQAVFIALAQNARRIRRGEVLSAWLLAVTRRVAAMTKRSEARRRERERNAVQMMQMMNDQPDAEEWGQIAPHLDDAIAELAEQSRTILVLRYFEGLSTEQVASRLHLTPEAARQRISRSLEKLRTIFCRRGISVSGVALGTLLTAHAVQAAPMGLAATTAAVASIAATATGAAAGGSSAGLLVGKGMAAIMTWTKAKVAAVAIALALLGGTVAVVVPKMFSGGDKVLVVQPGPGASGSSTLPPDAAIGPGGMVGRLALSVPIKLPDGKDMNLAALRGRHVLLHTWLCPSSQPPGDRKGNLPIIWERFGGEEGFAMVGVAPQTVPQYTSLGNRLLAMPALAPATRPTPWPQGYGNRDNDEMDRFVRAEACYVIDPGGRIIASLFDPRAAYGELDRRLSRGSTASSPIRVLTTRKALAEASPAYNFGDIPPISADDAAKDASISILDGAPGMGRSVAALMDGRGASNQDDPANSLHLFHHWLYGRLKMDLGRAVDISQINTYSWHKSQAPQVYRVFGSDGTAPDFNPSPGRGVDPAGCGWNLIAFVDTRSSYVPAEMGGQYAASIRSDTGSVGRYRYLLFMMFVTETDDWWGHTFYSEIDVIERKGAGTALAPAGKNRNEPRRGYNGFSIVELLVVIGIIGILISILLPTLAATQERARLLTCTNNLRNIWLGAQLHAHDHQGYLPVAGWHWAPQGGVCNPRGLSDENARRYTYYADNGVQRPSPFTVAIAASLGVKVRLDSRQNLEREMQGDAIRKHFRCPSQEEARQGFTQREDAPGNWTAPEDASSYVFNEAILGLRGCEPWRDPMPMGKLSLVRRPEIVLLAMDGCPRDRGKDRWLVFPDIGPEDTIADFMEAAHRPDSVWGHEILDYGRHNYRANVLFVDGHISTVLLLPSDLGKIGISKGVYR